MARIYATLKRQVVTGAFVPGARLDPARLKDDLAASTMPIRDALQRLTGEGLVENSQNEGFRVVRLSEAAARDLYDWCRDLARLSLGRADHHVEPQAEVPQAGSYAEEVTRVLLRIANLSANHEHRRAMTSLCEKTFLLRAIEERIMEDPGEDVLRLKGALDNRNLELASEAFERFHDNRMALLPSIVSSLRDRAEIDRSVIF